jgi:hypothetical protein
VSDDAPSFSRSAPGPKNANALPRTFTVRDSIGVPAHATPSSVSGSASAPACNAFIAAFIRR